ncbi:hypothetical protein H6504_02080 [Candidatus Woesearchaeota archaeon]|nr:hypothetical protein [Candidatus Woesearchaeota archaeon]
MSNHVRQRDEKRGGSRCQLVSRYRKIRAKTFSSEEAAKTWAKEQGIEKYTLENLKSSEATTKKIRVVVV